MSLLNYPRRGESITAWLRKLFLYIKTLELKGDGNTCRIDRTASGSVLHILLPSGGNTNGGFGYCGPFRIGFDEEHLLIQNGGNPSTGNAGLANVNGDLLTVPTGSITPQVGYVLLKATQKNNKVTFSWEIATDLPVAINGSGIAYSAIGEIVKIDDVDTIVQYHNGVLNLLIGEECGA